MNSPAIIVDEALIHVASVFFLTRLDFVSLRCILNVPSPFYNHACMHASLHF